MKANMKVERGEREGEKEADPVTKDDGTWGTLEELLLACAVNRHGTERWDSVALELRRRTPTLQAFNSHDCRRKYRDLLRRRFGVDADGHGGEPETDRRRVADMVEELRERRVAELRREVQQCDVSIMSLQLKVKRLELERERERERGLGGGEGRGTDLAEDRKDGAGERPQPDDSAWKAAAGNESDGGGGSFNESNNTSQKCENRGAGEQNGRPKPERDEPTSNTVGSNPVQTGSKPIGGRSFDVGDDTSSPGPAAAACGKSGETEAAFGPAESNGLLESAAESKRAGVAKQNAEVQSSARVFGRRRRRRRRTRADVPAVSTSGEEPEAEAEASPATRVTPTVKSQPLLRLIGIIRSHKLGWAFDRRLRTQETERYTTVVLQHVDLEKVESRLHEGTYGGDGHAFFRDLLLVFNNAAIFFRRGSPEHNAALHLRSLVARHMPRPAPDPTPHPPPRPPSLLSVKRPTHRKRGGGVKLPRLASPEGSARRGGYRRRAGGVDPRRRSENGSPDGSFARRGGGAQRGAATGKTQGRPGSGPGRRRRWNRAAAEETAGRESSDSESSSSDDSHSEPPPSPRACKGGTASEAAKNKKRGVVEFLKRMKQGSPGERSRGLAEGEDEDDDDDEKNGASDPSENSDEEDDGVRGPARRVYSGGPASAGNNSISTNNNNGRVKRGVGRPPRGPTPASASAASPVSQKRKRQKVRAAAAEGGARRPNKRASRR